MTNSKMFYEVNTLLCKRWQLCAVHIHRAEYSRWNEWGKSDARWQLNKKKKEKNTSRELFDFTSNENEDENVYFSGWDTLVQVGQVDISHMGSGWRGGAASSRHPLLQQVPALHVRFGTSPAPIWPENTAGVSIIEMAASNTNTNNSFKLLRYFWNTNWQHHREQTRKLLCCDVVPIIYDLLS